MGLWKKGKLPLPEASQERWEGSSNSPRPPCSGLPAQLCQGFSLASLTCSFPCQASKDAQWKRAMDYLGAISELNYMTQIVIMLYEDNNKVRAGPTRAGPAQHLAPSHPWCGLCRTHRLRRGSTWSCISVPE